MAELCNNEDFWRIRFTEKYGSEAAKYKPPERKWKQHYLKMIVDLGTFSKDPWSYFKNMVGNLADSPDGKFLFDNHLIDIGKTENPKYERYHNCHWLLNLGDKVTLTLPLFVGTFVYRTHTSKKSKENEKGYFSPHDILKICYDFYQENVTDEEYQIYYAQYFPAKRDKRGEYLSGGLNFIFFRPMINTASGEISRSLNIK